MHVQYIRGTTFSTSQQMYSHICNAIVQMYVRSQSAPSACPYFHIQKHLYTHRATGNVCENIQPLFPCCQSI